MKLLYIALSINHAKMKKKKQEQPAQPPQNLPKLKLPENKAWLDFTLAEKRIFKPHITSVSWKEEGGAGPVWVNFDIPEYDPLFKEWGKASCNYKDSETSKGNGEGKYAAWFTYSSAQAIANRLQVEFLP